MDNQKEETVEIHRPKSEIEANIIRDILKQEGIDSGFDSDISSWFDGLFSLSMPEGIGRIFVFKEDADQAKAVISDYLTAIKEPPDVNADEDYQEGD